MGRKTLKNLSEQFWKIPPNCRVVIRTDKVQAFCYGNLENNRSEESLNGFLYICIFCYFINIFLGLNSFKSALSISHQNFNDLYHFSSERNISSYYSPVFLFVLGYAGSQEGLLCACSQQSITLWERICFIFVLYLL